LTPAYAIAFGITVRLRLLWLLNDSTYSFHRCHAFPASINGAQTRFCTGTTAAIRSAPATSTILCDLLAPRFAMHHYSLVCARQRALAPATFAATWLRLDAAKRQDLGRATDSALL